MTTHRTQKCPNVWHAAADESNEWVIQKIAEHFYFKKCSASTQHARCVTNRENLSWEKETTVENAMDNFTINFYNNVSNADS